MRRKYIRYILIEHRVRGQIALGLILLGLIFFQNRVLSSQRKEMAQIKAQKEFVMKIPDMERAILGKTEKPKEFVPQVVVEPPRELSFEGSSNQAGVLHTVINGEVLMQGDRIGDYIVQEISIGFVQLKHVGTGEVKEYLFEYSE